MRNTQASRLVVAFILLAGALPAQSTPKGHWTGTIEVPGQPLTVEVDLDSGAKGWVGSIAIPAQGSSGLPLEGITVSDAKCTFRIKGAPGEPTFDGTLSTDGKSLSGNFTQGGGTIPFKLTRSGEAKVEEVKKSPAVAKEFVGTWEGTLEAGQSLRLVLKITNEEGGATAVLTSVDQGNAEIPVTGIQQTSTKLTLSVKAVGGEYAAEINKAGTELAGTWTQGGNQLPLTMKRK